MSCCEYLQAVTPLLVYNFRRSQLVHQCTNSIRVQFAADVVFFRVLEFESCPECLTIITIAETRASNDISFEFVNSVNVRIHVYFLRLFVEISHDF